MKSTYLYVRVSTDEQKKKDYSLPEQEDRLLRYCEQNQIAVRGKLQKHRKKVSKKIIRLLNWHT
jgi:DNA invertase Pin-like site-specific DNA recombinase